MPSRSAAERDCALRGIAFPFVPAVAQFKHLLHHQKHRFRGDGASLDGFCKVDVPDFDRTVPWIDPQKTRESARLPGVIWNHSVELGILRSGNRLQPITERLEFRERTVGEIGPVPALIVGRKSAVACCCAARGTSRQYRPSSGT